MKDFKNILERLQNVKEIIQERTTCPTTDDSDVGAEIDSDVKRWLPRFRISEAWGDPNSMDRQAIQKFIDRLPMMDGTDWKAKIKGISNFISQCQADCQQGASSSEALSGLVFAESMHAIVGDFNEATAGFMFEGLLAALFGFESRAITTSGGGYTPITDVEMVKRDNEGEQVIELISAKLLNDADTAKASGSSKNMFLDLLKRNAGGGVKPMKFIVALKSEDPDPKVDDFIVNFYEFTVGLKDRAIAQKYFKNYVVAKDDEGGLKFSEKRSNTGPNKKPWPSDNDKTAGYDDLKDLNLKNWDRWVAQEMWQRENDNKPPGMESKGLKKYIIDNADKIKEKSRTVDNLWLSGGRLYTTEEKDEQMEAADITKHPQYGLMDSLIEAHKGVDYDFSGYESKARDGQPAKGYKLGQIKTHGPAATLRLPSREKLKEDGGGFLKALEKNLVPIYKELAKLSHNLDTYFLYDTSDPKQGDGVNCRITAAMQAQGNIATLGKEVQSSMESVGSGSVKALEENKKLLEITNTQLEEIIDEELEVVLNGDDI